HTAVALELRGCWKRPMIQTQRAPKGFELAVEVDEGARNRRDQLVATLPWLPPDQGLEGSVEGWSSQAEEALQAMHGMPDSQARYYKGRARGPWTITAPLAATAQEGRPDRASEAAHLWLSLRNLAKRRWDLGPLGPDAPPDGYRGFRAQNTTVFDGTVFSSFWGEIGLQSEKGCGLLAMIEQIVAKRAKDGAEASKIKWGEFSEQAFERQGPLAHEVTKKTHGGPAPALEAGSADLALVGQPALEKALADWPPLWSDPSRFAQGRPGLWSVGEWSTQPIAVDDIRLAAREFPRTAGLGWGSFHPRLLLEVGDDILPRLASLLNSWERNPRCGELWARVGTCLSEAVVANDTVIAGCSCATALAKLLPLSALRAAAAAAAAPVAGLLGAVGGVSARVAGPLAMAAQQLGATRKAFCAKVEEANLPLSRHKTKALATSKELRQALMRQPGWDLAPEDFADVRGDLGGDAVSGPYRRVTTSTSRERLARAQGRKLTRLFRPSLDRARVFRAGPAAKATCGSAVMGVPSGRLRQLRAGATKARGRLPRGAALGLASLAQTSGWKRDPLTIITRTALTAYVEMVWASLLPEAAARSCLTRGLAIAQKPHPWRLVKEPNSALVLTLARVGWGFIQSDPYKIHDANGGEYDVRRHSPAFFGNRIAQDCRAAIGLEEVARQGPSMWGWRVPPFWQPIMDLACHRSEVWDQRHQRALRSLVQNTYWCQARAGAVDPSVPTSCLLCGYTGGSLYHRSFQCEAHAARGRDYLQEPLRQAAEQVKGQGYLFTELFARGLFPDASVRQPRPGTDYFQSSTSRRTSGPHLDGHRVFVDGSGLDQAHPRLRAAGWSVVVHDAGRRLAAEAQGAAPIQEAPEQLARGRGDCAVKVLTDQ
ncbi:unnamed protein product, partial [Prorocentrum cordatum]